MEDRQFNISITAGTVLKTVLILVGAWLLFTLRSIVLDVVTAIVIASAIEPGVRALMRNKIPRIPAVILIYLLLFSTFFCLFYFFFPSVLEDFAAFISSLPIYLNAFGQTGAFDTYANILGIPAPSAISAVDIMADIRSAFDISGTLGNAFSAFARIFGGVFSFVLIVVFSFYFAVIETGVDDFLRVIAPKRHQSYVIDLWKRSQHKIGLWMQGQLILALIMGVLVYLGLTIIGVKHALLLAVIAALFEIIPVFGPILAAVPAVMIGFVDGGFAIGGLVIALYVIFQQFENHLIYPLVVTRVVGVPPLLVILALIMGAELAGFLGIILSVPVAATIQELARDIESGRLGRQFES
ncbi:MAG: AI-2E family transporter [bacterium]|nr:AI-2E family transporter [bacterium]